jgi:cupin fold WbuC family metalloprotein
MNRDRPNFKLWEYDEQSLPFKRLTQDLVNDVADQSRESSRLRKNYNFHDRSERVQRFLNVLQPGTYVHPHRHQRSTDVNGFEFFLVLQGEIGIIIFDETGQILHLERISAQGPTRGIELAEGTFHTLVALIPDTVILELKEGPYNATTDKDFLDMFPQEGGLDAQNMVQTWQALFLA